MNSQFDSSSGWLQENSRFLILLAVVLLGGGALGWYLPRAKQADLQNSWGLLSQFTTELQAAQSYADVNSALLPVQVDDRAYPWALARAVTWAAYKQDAEAIDALEAKLGELDSNAAQMKVLEGGQSAPFLAVLKSRLNGLKAVAEMDPAPAAATGPKIKFTLTSSGGTTYELMYQLYGKSAPQTTAHFLARLESGAFDGATIAPSTQGNFQLTGLAEDDAPALPIEKAFGYFHANGSLSTIIQNGGNPGDQSPSKLQFFGSAQYAQDGITTVLGQLLEGEEILQQIASMERSTESPGSFAETFTLKAEKL
jgi:cyclophilin family peptidyl-prolyl cis-trans isomerase